MNELDCLGGLHPVTGDAFVGVAPEELWKILRSYERSLPGKFIDFVATWGCCSSDEEVVFRLAGQSAVHLHAESVGIPNRRHNSAGFSHFYGLNLAEETLNLSWALKTYNTRMPEGSVPVAADGSGGQICYIADSPVGPGFFWWDHDNEWDEDDYRVDTGEDMPEVSKFQNVYFIAPHFEGFLAAAEIVTGLQSESSG
ncbi:SMI1/KNR4 family protein [Williamsia sp. CHRR-6]|uniref:SMI1/KNR4 family protein n=1 Tax=Williamsia sp. CHRR-6 TaxID=2835871 RepID=UPI001BDA9854|nr:SMI1/KNR4 family protein [Williamsia sp. CHRR-6]MBT0568223.1 hypothetical protein [Williamsia sp. CHRR-6]